MTPWFPSEVKAESVVCDHCGASEERTLFEGPDRLYHLPGMFRLVACPRCGWVRQNPRPAAGSLDFYYPTYYINYVTAIEDEPRRWVRFDRRYGMIKRRRAIERLQPRGRLLDVGCATGLFLHEMDQAGWQVYGVEPSAHAAGYARSRFNLRLHQGMLQGANLPPASFDVVTFWDVLEHVTNPWADLKVATQLLADDGLLVVRVPNLEGLDARWFGNSWLGWDLPRHLYLFPRRALMLALEELDFAVIGTSCPVTGQPSFMLSLRLYLESRTPPSSSVPGFAQRLGNSVPARIALAPLFWSLDRARLATMITVFARKLRPSNR